MTDKQDEVRRELYEQWLKHPITQMLLGNLEKDKHFFVDKISINAVSSDVTDTQIRYAAFGVKNLDGVISMITNYEKFTKYIKQP